jgi:hypothetical protein
MNKCFRRIFFLITLAITFSSFKSKGCDCIMYPVRCYVDTSQYIIIGKVVQNLDTLNTFPLNVNIGYKAKVLLINILKSKDDIKVRDTIEFSSDFNDCSLKFTKGETYLLFAHKVGDKFYVYHCSYSDNLKMAKKYLRQVRKELKKMHR